MSYLKNWRQDKRSKESVKTQVNIPLFFSNYLPFGLTQTSFEKNKTKKTKKQPKLHPAIKQNTIIKIKCQ